MTGRIRAWLLWRRWQKERRAAQPGRLLVAEAEVFLDEPEHLGHWADVWIGQPQPSTEPVEHPDR